MTRISQRKLLTLAMTGASIAMSVDSKVSAQPYRIDMAKQTPRSLPDWYKQDKFGIFVVWGLYSVPAYSDGWYAEWYWKEMERSPSTKAFHERVYGKDFPYEHFADQFQPHFFDPDQWCELFAKSGAKFVITTANYHDGYAMYPTQYSLTATTNDWNAAVRGPKMDLIDAINKAGERHGLKMGLYYSWFEWFHPMYLDPLTKADFPKNWVHKKFKEMVERYKPWSIFLDGDWEYGYKGWHAEELAEWLYNESPVKDYVVVNDRWGLDAQGVFGDVFESEYGGGKYTSADHPWQEDRGIGKSYGYNRNESIYDYDSRETLIQRLSHVVGGGGNFLLDVGPTGDGRIPVIMQQRLLEIGEWMEVNGDAIYGTDHNPFWPRLFDWGTLTTKPGKLYVHIHDNKLASVTIDDFVGQVGNASVLTASGKMTAKAQKHGEALTITWNPLHNDPAVTVLELDVTGTIAGSTIPIQNGDGVLAFNCWAMDVHGHKARPWYGGYLDDLSIVGWSDPSEYVTADFKVIKPGNYDVFVTYATFTEDKRDEEGKRIGRPGSKFSVQIGNAELTGETVETNNKFVEKVVGAVTFDRAGKYALSVKAADAQTWKGFNLQEIAIRPSK